MKPLKLFNTLSRKIENFEPLEPGKVGIYCCGPTVYNYQHIGNLRTYIFEDVLVRTLRYAGYDVKHVMNITDVGHLVSDGDNGEDKMLVAARREKKKSFEIAEYYTNIFFADCAKLGIKRPDVVCKATDHINEMIEMTQEIEKNGLAYFADGNVYFDINKCKDYGKLAKLDLTKLQAGARIEVDSVKHNPLDFVLWFTKSKFDDQELKWDSPWGPGYPGWHIECSAMSVKYLGEQFDIHCGGIDHISVHHTNEIAQSEAALCSRGDRKPWVKYWMHGEFLVVDQEKMSKSKGTFLTLASLEEKKIDPLAYRYLCLSAHYQAQLSFSWESLEGASNALEKLRRNILNLKKSSLTLNDSSEYILKHDQAVLNDLNMPQALANLWMMLGDKEISDSEKLGLAYKFDEVLGLGMQDWQQIVEEIPAEVALLAQQRDQARKDKNWAESDRLRDTIKEFGYSVVDSGGAGKVVKS